MARVMLATLLLPKGSSGNGCQHTQLTFKDRTSDSTLKQLNKLLGKPDKQVCPSLPDKSKTWFTVCCSSRS
jgi:hypothetical protein